ncbi:hypothetical protein GCM10009795_039860 [Nocardioides hankookensis]|uniref:Uncharacterized protein n=1 Tax=Nocardioides hankookensis TaxID=443157 RepID=A0ABW1LRJ3_9ACTN
MSYTPGTLHVAWSNIDGTAALGKVVVLPSSDVVKDPTGTVLMTGAQTVDLAAGTVVGDNGTIAVGEVSIELPPSTGMDPDVTYTVALQLYGQADPEPVTGVEIIAGEVTELASWVTPIPRAEVPNVKAQVAGLMTSVDADPDSGFRRQLDSRLTATITQVIDDRATPGLVEEPGDPGTYSVVFTEDPTDPGTFLIGA